MAALELVDYLKEAFAFPSIETEEKVKSFWVLAATNDLTNDASGKSIKTNQNCKQQNNNTQQLHKGIYTMPSPLLTP